MDLYAINDALSALAQEQGVTLDDDVLNDVTHHVARVLEGNVKYAGAAFAWERLADAVLEHTGTDEELLVRILNAVPATAGVQRLRGVAIAKTLG